MGIWDILILLTFSVIMPISSFIHFRRAVRETPEYISNNRRKHYRTTMFWQWALCIALVLVWQLNGRDWAALGFRFEVGVGLWIGTAITLATLGFFYLQLHQASTGKPGVKEALLKEFGDVALFLPQVRPELNSFYGLSFTAGIVEEILFRGFFIWVFTQFMPLWAAAILGIAIFALVHSYQGWEQLPALLAISAILMGVFLLTGSLLLPMLLHIFGDMIQGRLAFEVLRDAEYTTATS